MEVGFIILSVSLSQDYSSLLARMSETVERID